jgi:hypothetical protein
MKPPEEIRDLFCQSKASFSSEKNRKILKVILSAYKTTQKGKSTVFKPNLWRIILGSKAACLAITLLIISSLVTCFVLFRKNVNLRDELELAKQNIATTPIDDSVTINFYLKEHQETIAQKASLNSIASQPVQMQINQDDILYFELYGNQSELMNPGIIVRRPPYQDQISSSETPAISNGHTLTLSEAREAADFDLVLPSWLQPCYRLEKIKKIEGRDALQLLYTNSIDSVSLFEQPLDGQRGLEPKDFREYAVYQNKGKVGGTILAWRDDALSYVLIGKTEISQLMNMAQSINAAK